MNVAVSLLLIATIVAGEAPHGCIDCYRVTACTVLNDIERGQALTASRWRGRRNPSDAHLAAVQWAITEGNCTRYPKCRFLGNADDAILWRAYGWISHETHYCNGNGCSVCVHLAPNSIKRKYE